MSRRIESKNAAVLSVNSEPLAPASALDADLLEEHDVNNGSSRSDTLHSVRYQPRESQILILLILILYNVLYNVRKPNQAIVMRPNPGPVSEIHVKAIEPQEEYPE